MKANSEIRKRMVKMQESFKPITPALERYAYSHSFDKVACESRNTMLCTECGHTWKVKDGAKVNKGECPHCHKRFSRVNHNTLRHNEVEYFCHSFECMGFQVLRYWQVRKHAKPGFIEYWNAEVGAMWIDEKGHNTDFCLPRQMMPRYLDSWNFNGDIVLRRSSNLDRCPVGAVKCTSMLPLLKRNGWKGNAVGYNADDTIKYLLTNPVFESFYKTKQYGLCCMIMRHYNDHNHDKWKRIIKICQRHNRKFNEYSEWTDFQDYVRQLEAHHYDIYNPKFLFPKNFKKEHQRFIDLDRAEKAERARIVAEQRARDNEKKRQWMIEYAPRFADMVLTQGKFTIKPLITYEDFKAESDVMEHCILTYYGKAETLLLSIEYNGQKTETAEVNLHLNDLVQCRGHQNHPTVHHATIVKFIQDSMKIFQERFTKQMTFTTLPAIIYPTPLWKVA